MNQNEDLNHEIKNLREELSQMRSTLTVLNELLAGKLATATSSETHKLKIFIGQNSSLRMPYEIFFDGIIQSHFAASPVRTAIVLILLLDLKQRLEADCGINNLNAQMLRALTALENSTETNSNENKLRVAAYRFFDFCESKAILHGKEFQLNFNHDLYQLNILPLLENPNEQKKFAIDISTDCPEINQIISENIGTISLSYIQREKIVYVPSGEKGTDSLLLKMYDHDHELHVTSLYLRPPFASYPEELLNKIKIGELVKKRKQLAFAGYSNKRFLFEEVLNINVVRSLLKQNSDGTFKYYPAGVTADDIKSHLHNLIDILQKYENYNLYLTDMAIPFVLVNYEIKTQPIAQNYLSFFQSNNSIIQSDLGCLVINDATVWHGIFENVVKWILHHPSTIKDRETVIKQLQDVLEGTEQCEDDGES